VPGLLIGCHSPSGTSRRVFVPGADADRYCRTRRRRRIRQLFAEGRVGREPLAFESERELTLGGPHFYGTANSNQMLMEVMGLHRPGQCVSCRPTALAPMR